VNGEFPQLALIVGLVLLNGALAGSEIAMITLRDSQLRRLEARSATGAVLARLARDPNRFLATIQLGITVAGFLASATAAVAVADRLRGPLRFLGDAAEPVAVVVVTLTLAFFTLVVGELAPKRVAMQQAERWGLMAARPVSLMATASRPAVWLLGRASDVIVRLVGADPTRGRDEPTEEELRDLVATRVSFTAHQRRIIDSAFDIDERSLREMLVPRTAVFTLVAAMAADEALPLLVASGHSRAPVVGVSLDDAIGVVHLRDLIGRHEQLGTLVQPTVLLPESLSVLDALHQLQLARQHMAIVVSEHGGAEGIVTVEDLVEELVGEIYDATDRDVLAVETEPDGSLVLPGSFPMHDLRDIGVDLPEGDYATVAGLVLARLGRVVDRPGDVLDVEGWRIEILAVGNRSIRRIRLKRRPDSSRQSG
jgi:putative hemolysin